MQQPKFFPFSVYYSFRGGESFSFVNRYTLSLASLASEDLYTLASWILGFFMLVLRGNRIRSTFHALHAVVIPAYVG